MPLIAILKILINEYFICLVKAVFLRADCKISGVSLFIFANGTEYDDICVLKNFKIRVVFIIN